MAFLSHTSSVNSILETCHLKKLPMIALTNMMISVYIVCSVLYCVNCKLCTRWCFVTVTDLLLYEARILYMKACLFYKQISQLPLVQLSSQFLTHAYMIYCPTNSHTTLLLLIMWYENIEKRRELLLIILLYGKGKIGNNENRKQHKIGNNNQKINFY